MVFSHYQAILLILKNGMFKFIVNFIFYRRFAEFLHFLIATDWSDSCIHADLKTPSNFSFSNIPNNCHHYNHQVNNISVNWIRSKKQNRSKKYLKHIPGRQEIWVTNISWQRKWRQLTKKPWKQKKQSWSSLMPLICSVSLPLSL